MKIEDQVCTLEQAEQLQELSIDVPGYFMWVECENEDYVKYDIGKYEEGGFGLIGVGMAYTVAELGVMLPSAYDTMRITVRKGVYGWKGFDDSGKDCPPGGSDKHCPTEAQCRADMLIHLLENKLITTDQVNQSLKQ